MIRSGDIWARVSNTGAVLGRGSYGTVTKIEFDGRQACIKESKDISDLPLFLREACMLRRLGGIGGAPILFAAALDKPIIVMSLFTGDTVLELLEDDVTPFWMWLNILQGIIHQVYQIHTENIVHNDIKLDNLIVETDSEELKVSIIDFGLASFSGPNTGFPTGTKTSYKKYKHYSPELYLDGLSSTQSDTWSLGVLIDRIVTGVTIDADLHHIADSLKTLQRAMKHKEAICRPSLLVVDKQLSDILDSCLEIMNRPCSPPVESVLNYEAEADAICCKSESENDVSQVVKDDSVIWIEPMSAIKRKRELYDTDEGGPPKKFRENDSVCVIIDA